MRYESVWRMTVEAIVDIEADSLQEAHDLACEMTSDVIYRNQCDESPWELIAVEEVP